MSLGTTIQTYDETADLRQCWQTPVALFDKLHSVLRFTVDACASPHNALLPRYWTAEQDCTKQNWSGERVFCNPPFGNTAAILANVKAAEMACFLFPSSSMTTKYRGKNVPDYIAMPDHRIKFVPPSSVIKAVSPSLGTFLCLYGITQDEADKLKTVLNYDIYKLL